MSSAWAALTGPLRSTTISVTDFFLPYTTSTPTTVTNGPGVGVGVGLGVGVQDDFGSSTSPAAILRRSRRDEGNTGFIEGDGGRVFVYNMDNKSTCDDAVPVGRLTRFFLTRAKKSGSTVCPRAKAKPPDGGAP
jgi:hypothetical protein